MESLPNPGMIIDGGKSEGDQHLENRLEDESLERGEMDCEMRDTRSMYVN